MHVYVVDNSVHMRLLCGIGYAKYNDRANSHIVNSEVCQCVVSVMKNASYHHRYILVHSRSISINMNLVIVPVLFFVCWRMRAYHIWDGHPTEPSVLAFSCTEKRYKLPFDWDFHHLRIDCFAWPLSGSVKWLFRGFEDNYIINSCEISNHQTRRESCTD